MKYHTFYNSHGFYDFYDFLWKMENAPSLAPRHAEAPQTIVIISKFTGPGGVRSDRKSRKSQKTSSSLFSHFPLEIDKWRNFMNFAEFLAKRGYLGGPAPRSFFSRNIKVSKLPEYRKWSEIVLFLKFHGISWNFKKITISDNFSVFWRLRNLDIP